MTISFYCKECELDQDLPAFLIDNDIFVINSLTDFYWKKNETYREWYVAKCEECNHELIRLKGSPHADPYYRLSKRVKIQRQALAKDLIQYGEEGFQSLYQNQWRELEKKREESETKEKQKLAERKKLLDKNPMHRKTLEKVFSYEDKLST